MTRDEYVTECKRCALEYLDRGDAVSAVVAMLSDMGKRDDTRPNPALGMLGIMAANTSDEEARRFIEGFN